MSSHDDAQASLRSAPRAWLVTGAAGFVGSNLVEALLRLEQEVIGLDNLSTGHRSNVEDVQAQVGSEAASRFRFIEGDIRDLDLCREACQGADLVLHQAALGSVPRSIEDPVAAHQSNVDGTVNVLVAARDAAVRRVVYASSSSVYGDHPALPKVEDAVGRPLSPYALTKRIGEQYAEVFQSTYGLETVGLRYFNVFGPRQDPNGAYAAVIPRWIGELLAGAPSRIYGDGETSRDFCYVANVVQANILAALAPAEATGHVYNIANGGRTTLNELFAEIREGLTRFRPEIAGREPEYEDFRPGDVRHSQADISKSRRRLGYEPTHSLRDGLREALPWYVEHLQRSSTPSPRGAVRGGGRDRVGRGA